MSSIEEAKAGLSQVVTESEGTASALTEFKEAFDSITQGVLASIGNTATGKDQEIAQIYQQAKDAVDGAISTLMKAADASKTFADGL
ncbi:hypothetical protein FB381_2974 [Nocardioides albertanoniae]|uniref:Type VII secretion system (Wss) protein ESAT-6 n=1 Tax=Nocardioides albertanoniae TaxID=1175486 RepID=A0A543A8Y8_9ACTN|nr:hypothetical protein [Nocardioides albertanoniae]TQL69073.1 hypothetical protein FB381_2974 [Nocardioides albertanoniae]